VRAAAFLFLLVIACGPANAPGGGSTAPGDSPKYGGTLNHRETTDPVNWDVSYNTNPPNEDGVALSHNSLIGFKMGPDVDYTELVLQPEIAERWEVSPDAKVYTFQLRKGVKFQNVPPVNGRELTSADVKWTFEYRTRKGEVADKKLPPGLVDYMYEGMELIETPDRYPAGAGLPGIPGPDAGQPRQGRTSGSTPVRPSCTSHRRRSGRARCRTSGCAGPWPCPSTGTRSTR